VVVVRGEIVDIDCGANAWMGVVERARESMAEAMIDRLLMVWVRPVAAGEDAMATGCLCCRLWTVR